MGKICCIDKKDRINAMLYMLILILYTGSMVVFIITRDNCSTIGSVIFVCTCFVISPSIFVIIWYINKWLKSDFENLLYSPPLYTQP